MGERILTEHDIMEIKTLLWKGQAQDVVAAQFAITQTTISRIYNGKSYEQTPWPDGTEGGMPQSQRISLRKVKYAGVRAAAISSQLKQAKASPRAIAAAIALLDDHTQEASEQELMSAVADTGPVRSETEGSKQERQEDEAETAEVSFTEQDFLELAERAPANKLIKGARSNTFLYRQAVLTVFNNLGSDLWDTPMARKLVLSTMKEMERSAESTAKK